MSSSDSRNAAAASSSGTAGIWNEATKSRTLGNVSELPQASTSSNASARRKRQRVSTQALCHSISVLHANGFEENFLESHGQHVDALRIQRARFGDDVGFRGSTEHGQHSPLAAHSHDASRLELRIGSCTVEDDLDAPIRCAKVVER